jgi:nucleoside-diphosphate kinase
MKENTLVLIKPDAFGKHYTGDIIKRYETAGLTVRALKLLQMTPKLASKHYAEHIGRAYYDDLVGFMTSGPLVALVLSGEDAIARVREINGKTDPTEAAVGTIRRDFAESKSRNAVHASDSKESADREIHIFFNEAEICD